MVGDPELEGRRTLEVAVDCCQELAGRRNFEVGMCLHCCLVVLERNNLAQVLKWPAVKHLM